MPPAALLLLLSSLPGADPGPALAADVARWPPEEVVEERLAFSRACRLHLCRRARWDVLHREELSERKRLMKEREEAWELALGARREVGWGYPALAAERLERLRKLLGERDYAAGRLPELPCVGEFAWID
jgi:hypothetical protein